MNQTEKQRRAGQILFAEIRVVLAGLRRTMADEKQVCWCDRATWLGNPMIEDHTDACKQTQAMWAKVKDSF